MNAFTLAHFSISVRALSLTTILTPRFYSFQPYLFTTYNGGFESIIFLLLFLKLAHIFCDIIVLLAGSTLLICTRLLVDDSTYKMHAQQGDNT